jgi:hypothetical protein
MLANEHVTHSASNDVILPVTVTATPVAATTDTATKVTHTIVLAYKAHSTTVRLQV